MQFVANHTFTPASATPHISPGRAGGLKLCALRGLAAPVPLFPRRKTPQLRAIALDDSERLLHNHHASVASLRQLFTFTTERRSESHRNQRSPHRNIPMRRCRTIGSARFDLAKPDADFRFARLAIRICKHDSKGEQTESGTTRHPTGEGSGA